MKTPYYSKDIENALSLVETNSSVSVAVMEELSSIYDNLGPKTAAQRTSHPQTMPTKREDMNNEPVTGTTSTEGPSCKLENVVARSNSKHSDIASETKDDFLATESGVQSGEESSDLRNARRFKHPSSKRQQLTAEDAVEIYRQRPTNPGKALKRGSMMGCKLIAPKFGVSPKTIRDIWRGRTWIHATEHLWTDEERLLHAQRVAAGDADSGADADADTASYDDEPPASSSAAPPPDAASADIHTLLLALSSERPPAAPDLPNSLRFHALSDPAGFFPHSLLSPGPGGPLTPAPGQGGPGTQRVEPPGPHWPPSS
eukprot:CAMPEP_0172167308 /NCGR_PEP_ID=MMETSP1050-20130122/9498_1 /TAXON_ID=233186 /ORGANISM="Cryptomonas curvata, Strain CCAP979/52" /LENGTH=314 /DNA_ID=CAMNT_0012838081 /DNA_START=95 /DNA_END=1035 /DNA_ORIENTATION=-